MSIKDDFKISDYPKKLLVDSFEDWLPDEIIYRKKMGFVLPWEKWMKKELKDFSYEGLLHLDELNIFNIEEVKNLWENFLCGSKLVPWYKIWSLVILGKWLSVNKENV